MTTTANWDEGEEEASIWQNPSRRSCGEAILNVLIAVFGTLVMVVLIMFFLPVFLFKDCNDGTTRKRINTLLGFYYSIIALLGFLLLSLCS